MKNSHKLGAALLLISISAFFNWAVGAKPIKKTSCPDTFIFMQYSVPDLKNNPTLKVSEVVFSAGPQGNVPFVRFPEPAHPVIPPTVIHKGCYHNHAFSITMLGRNTKLDKNQNSKNALVFCLSRMNYSSDSVSSPVQILYPLDFNCSTEPQ
jgi:hypothetical protein